MSHSPWGVPQPGTDRVTVTDPVTALAMAWHREACALKRVASRQCKFWPYHVQSAERVVADLASMGVRAIGREPEEGLGEAWKAVKAVLPDGWGSLTIWPQFPSDPQYVEVRTRVAFGDRGGSRYSRIRGEGATLGDALRDLTRHFEASDSPEKP